MKGRMSIKSILGMTILLIFGFMFLNMSLAASTAKIVVETANVRQTPSVTSTILKQVSLNDEVEVLETQDEWIKVKSGNVTGYIKTSLLDLSGSVNTNDENKTNENIDTNVQTENVIEKQSEEITESESIGENNTDNIDLSTSDKKLEPYYVIETVNLKMVPLINATNLKTLENNTKVEIIKISNNWAYVKADDQKGWIYFENLKSQTQLDLEIAEAKRLAEIEAQKARLEQLLNAPVIKTVYVKSDSINVREEPNTEATVLKKVTQNTALSVIGSEDGWYQIRDGESIGYVSTQYVSDTKIVTRTETTSSSRSTISRSSVATQSSATVGNAVGGIVGIAQQYLGIPYLYGGTSPSTGFDCSGFTQYVYAQAGISIPRTTGGQATVGVAVSYADAQPGDLVIYPTHAAIYVGNGQVIHSPHKGQSIKYEAINTAGSGGYQIRRVN